MPATLYDLIPRDEKPGNDVLLGRFLDYVEGRRLQLYPAQETAIELIFFGKIFAARLLANDVSDGEFRPKGNSRICELFRVFRVFRG